MKLGVNLLCGFVYLLFFAPRYTLFHINNLSPFSLGALMAAKLWRRPVFLKIGSLGPNGDIAKTLKHPFGKVIWRAFRTADAFIAPTPVAERELRSQGVPSERIVVIPNALAPDWFEPAPAGLRAQARRELGLPDGPVVLFAGRLTALKGVRLLLEAWTRATARTPATLLMIGDGPDRGWIENRLRATGLEDSVRLLGWQTDPRRYFLAADIFAFASESETFGNVLAEAMASGLAIVSTPVGLAQTWLQHGRNALLSAPDVDAFAAELSQLLQNAELRARIAATACRDARERFAAPLILREYVTLFRQPIAAPGFQSTQGN